MEGLWWRNREKTGECNGRCVRGIERRQESVVGGLCKDSVAEEQREDRSGGGCTTLAMMR